MKVNTAQQEILLITSTSFARRQYCDREDTDNTNTHPANEKLKEACWNGLLKEMIPEIFEADDNAAKLYLWQVREAKEFFALELSEYPTGVNKYLSIDPYRFMEVKQFN